MQFPQGDLNCGFRGVDASIGVSDQPTLGRRPLQPEANAVGRICGPFRRESAWDTTTRLKPK